MISSRRGRPAGFSLAELLMAMALMALLINLIFSFLIPTLRASTRGAVRVHMQQEAMVTLAHLAQDVALSSPGGISLNQNVYNWLQDPLVRQYLANPSSISPSSVPQPSPPIIIAIQKLDNVSVGANNQAEQNWNTTAVPVYAWDGEQITRREFASGQHGITLDVHEPTPLDVAPNTTQLSGLAGDNSLTPRVLATGVSSFTISYPYDPSGSGPIQPVQPDTFTTQGGYAVTPLTFAISMSQSAATGARGPETLVLSRTISMRVHD